MSPHPGEVWLADLGLAAKTRPVVVVSRHDSRSAESVSDLRAFDDPEPTEQIRSRVAEASLSAGNERGKCARHRVASCNSTRAKARRTAALPPETLRPIREA